MEQELFKLAAGNGIWSALFVALFIYTVYDSRGREKRYEDREDSYQETIHDNQAIIKDLSKKYDLMEDIHKDVRDVKAEIKLSRGG